jgi:hypothetical protein
MDTRNQLLSDVEKFLTDRNMAPTAFGISAVNDGKFVSRLRAGANMTLATIDRVRAHIAEHEAVVQPQAGEAV